MTSRLPFKKAQGANSKKTSTTVLGIALALWLFCFTSFAQTLDGSRLGGWPGSCGSSVGDCAS